MKILAIETSCDETAAAVVEAPAGSSAALAGKPTSPVKVLSNIVASSEEMHKKTGGIVPEVASREQVKAIIPVIEESIKVSKCKSIKDIDAVAVTVGPGLVGSLLVGVETARALAYAWEKPIVPVNHLVAHLYANWINPKSEARNSKQIQNSNFQIPKFPAVGLVVSGGHTDLVVMEQVGPPSRKATVGRVSLRLLGTTRDDAAGECFDKGARILGLPYPGGPAVAAEAAKLKSIKVSKCKSVKLPRPLIQENTYDFSFSGLKTAVLRQAQDRISKEELAFEIQEAIVEVLTERVMRAVEEFRPKSVLLGGGVASNNRLRQLLKSEIRNSKHETKLFIPPVELCTDNAVMIGAAAYYNYPFDFAQGKSPLPWQEVRADPGLEITEDQGKVTVMENQRDIRRYLEKLT